MTKLQFQSTELQKFLDLSAYTRLTPENVLYSPITEYIKIELNKGFCKLTLTSNETFVQYTFSVSIQSKETLLISYLNLKKFFSNIRKEITTISETENKVTFTDGSFTSSYTKDPSILLSNFPVQPDISKIEFRRIGKDLINKLKVSKKFILPEAKDKLRPVLNLASIKENLLLSTDAHISCLYELNEDFGFATFSPKEIDLISNFDYFDYFQLLNWNIIKYKTILFCNKLQEGLDSGQIHKTVRSFVELVDKEKVIRINVVQLYDFCKSVKSYEKDSTVNSYLQIADGYISLSYHDIVNSIELHQEAQAEITGYSVGYKICFVQSKISKVLESLEDSVINLSECVQTDGSRNYMAFWLNSDSKFHSICSKGFEAVKDQTESVN
jgi:hypothetical protein